MFLREVMPNLFCAFKKWLQMFYETRDHDILRKSFNKIDKQQKLDIKNRGTQKPNISL